MSLLLREACEEVLLNCGLGEYHARVTNKCLSIAGSCGNIIFTISGIKFSKSNPNRAEVKFASKLLDEFCSTHLDKISEVLETKKVLVNYPKVELPDGIIVTNNLKTIYKNFDKTGGNLIYVKDSNTFHLGTVHNNWVALTDLDKFKNKTLHKELKLLLSKAIKYDLVSSAYHSAVSALNACQI